MFVRASEDEFKVQVKVRICAEGRTRTRGREGVAAGPRVPGIPHAAGKGGAAAGVGVGGRMRESAKGLLGKDLPLGHNCARAFMISLVKIGLRSPSLGHTGRALPTCPTIDPASNTPAPLGQNRELCVQLCTQKKVSLNQPYFMAVPEPKHNIIMVASTKHFSGCVKNVRHFLELLFF